MKDQSALRSGRRDCAEQGSVTPVTLLLGLVFIVFPVLVLVLSLPAWEQRSVDAQDAARVAVRAMVTADNWPDGLTAALEAVAAVAGGDNIPANEVSLSMTGSLEAGALVSASVTVLVPGGDIPFLGLVGPLHFTATSTTHVDSYRDSPS